MTLVIFQLLVKKDHGDIVGIVPETICVTESLYIYIYIYIYIYYIYYII
jgi:hypothetical protein